MRNLAKRNISTLSVLLVVLWASHRDTEHSAGLGAVSGEVKRDLLPDGGLVGGHVLISGPTMRNTSPPGVIDCIDTGQFGGVCSGRRFP